MSDAKKEHAIHGDNAGLDSITNYKLLIDPQLRRGEEKLLRYNGETYNTDNHGQGVVILRDPRPRMNRLWSRREKADLPVPRYKVDEWYIGAVPPREVTFSKLNDNITKQFMEKICSKFGKLERVRVYHHPKTQKHMGLSKVVFTSMKSAAECVKKLHMTSIMGNVIHVQIDSKGEILNKLFQRIARGEMVAETIPDVIRHTQDGISMSNKYKDRCHHSKRESRKSSQDDPRRRKSLDTRDKSHHPHHNHPSQEALSLKKGDRRDSRQDECEEENDQGNGEPLSSVEEDLVKNHMPMKRELSSESEDLRRRSTDLETRISSLLQGHAKPTKLENPDQKIDNSFRDEDKEVVPVEDGHHDCLKKNYSLGSMDSNVPRPSHSDEGLQNAAKSQPFAVDPEPLDIDHRKLSVSHSVSPKHVMPENLLEQMPDPLAHFDQSAKHLDMQKVYTPHDRIETHDRYSPRRYECSPPPYHYRSHRGKELGPPRHERNYCSPRHSPGYGRERHWKQGYSGRVDFERDRQHFMYENDERNRRDFHNRSRDITPPRRPPSPGGRRMHSPEDWPHPDRFSTHNLLPHRRRPSPSRFNCRRGSLSREESPPRFRRTPSPEIRKRISKEYNYRRRTPSPEKGPEVDGCTRSSSQRNSKDAESPKLSLDQRLKEMTGEPQVPLTGSGRVKRKKKDQPREQDNESSVDMEISEGESDGEKASRTLPTSVPDDQQLSRGPMPPDPYQSQEKWNFDGCAWNSFGPRGPIQVDPRMWNPMHPNVFKGYEREARPPAPFPVRFPQHRWPSQFHPSGGPSGILAPFGFGPSGSFPVCAPLGFQENLECSDVGQEIPQRVEDEMLCRCVLDDVVQDLKAIVGRDLNRKVVETMAFQVYESWWDENSSRKTGIRPPLPATQNDPESLGDKTDLVLNKASTIDKQAVKKQSQTLLNAFDPLNWAKNSFEMDGFRIGLGLRSAISKMPSFRVKKRPRTPTPPREEESEDSMKSKKTRRATGKENKVQPQRTSKDRKYNRIASLNSGGEDEGDKSEDDESDDDSSSGHHSFKHKIGVLDVDEVFSDSLDSEEDESSSEDEKSAEEEEAETSGEESEVESCGDTDNIAAQEEKIEKQSVDATTSETTEKTESVNNAAAIVAIRQVDSELGEQRRERPSLLQQTGTSVDNGTPASREDPTIASSLLSPTALGIAASSITPQQLRHIHPKKRHRLLSHDQYEPFAKVINIEKSKDELSLITEKERAVLEALTDMQRTPDRRFSQDSDNSTLSQVSQLDSKSPVKRIFTDSSEAQPCSSPQEELEAVQALLSIKKSAPVPSKNESEKSHQITVPKHKARLPPLPLTDRAKMAELAEEHNYFAPTFGPSRPHPTLDPAVSQILEEHNYCHSIAEQMMFGLQLQKDISSPRLSSTLTAESVYSFQDESSDIISAAERVKLRHVEPKKKITSKKHRKETQVLKFAERTKAEDLIIAYEMWCNGLELEDMKYLRDVYETYLEESNSPRWVNDSHWVPHPVTATTTLVKQKRSSRTRGKSHNNEIHDHHNTGCARTEGYYKMEGMVKLRQRREMYGEGDSHASVNVNNHASNKASETSGGNQGALDKNLGTREKRHFMRRIAAEVGSDAGDLLKYNQLMFRKKAVKFKKSSIHGWGLFAQEPIGADEMVIEYVGQVVRTLVAERREVNYTKLGIGSSYLFRIDTEHIIDATKCGNYARFMNHSCNPSCYAKVITVDTAKKIVIYSKGPIKKSEEITYDYKFPLEDDKVMCYCGAENCRRTLN